MDPHILVKFKQQPEAAGDPIASLVIFEWKDFDLVGVYPTADSMSVRTMSTELSMAIESDKSLARIHLRY